ncbi:MAG: maleylacetoacetate isomerase [Deltaproteobacteria bacterium]|nr:maleylacetoacetate isomerase [Deltaproteobacteria bacterium]
MIFFDYFRSSAGFRVRIALRLKRLDAERRSVHLRKGEQRDSGYLAVNPQGLVPALVLDDGAVLTQSLAIIEYLDTLSAENPLIPEDSLEAARVRQLSQLIACELHPLNNLRILNYLKEPLGHNQGEVNSWYQHWVESGFTAFERLIAEYAPNAHYCLGNFLTMADVCLVPQVFNAQRFYCPLDAYPKLMDRYERLASLPEFEKSFPQVQPDAG